MYIHDVIGSLREGQLQLKMDLHAMGVQLHMIEFALKELKSTLDSARGYVSRETELMDTEAKVPTDATLF